ncbi:YggS family pyridoxal phosphate-dependent enzyme [Terrabacter sp. MAHUQ-38]|uniref:YggS family pyridoxal phosphate-dependent enzyme n=1 Tax=unclassified Terrabacter TaxID=2630222 RepID=UPI00165E9F7E|nr:YggS family pyridoxal phosphate-dependent enzyme [Terrabacter sp. MAHUQ-38]MBC9823136.1 YggS family pyridoxal phosphate-dependent enzyme [Terrabacter sp. MAHUQ-38]
MTLDRRQREERQQHAERERDDQERLEQLRDNLAAVHERISRGCADAGRDPEDVTLIVVTKYFPVSDVLLLHRLGVRHFGENRDQEAAEKFREARRDLSDAGEQPPTLHFIGRLQSNKAGHVAGYADVVQSVDRIKLVTGLAKGAHAADRTVQVMLQVSLDADTARGGVLPEHVDDLADAVAAQGQLSLKGVMAVAPLRADPDECFARLREVADGIRGRHAGAEWISAGMSGDLEAGLRHGATHLRVGSAILGSRPSLL